MIIEHVTTNCLLLFHRNLTQALKYQKSNFRKGFLLLRFLKTDYTMVVDVEKPKTKWLGPGKFLLPWNISFHSLPTSFSLHRILSMKIMWGKDREGKTIILLLLYLRPNALLKEKMLVLQKRGVDLSSLTCKCWSWLDSNSFTRSFFLAQNDFSYHQRILIPLLLFLLKRWFYWIASL